MMYQKMHPTPLGPVLMKATENALVSLCFLDRHFEDAEKKENNILAQTCSELDAYFAGRLTQFTIPIAQDGTPFQQSVWRLLAAIGYGQTLSYMALSKKYGDIKAIRAIASANGKNNLAILVPCHRVIGTDRSLTGYAGGLWRKKWLLDHEAKWSAGVQQLF